MKKLRVEIIKRMSYDESIIYSSRVKLFVDGKEVNNNTKDVIHKMVENKECIEDRYNKLINDDVLVNPFKSIEEIKERLEEVRELVIKIENDCSENKSKRSTK